MAEHDQVSVPASTAPHALDPFSAFRSEMNRVVDGFFGGRSLFGVSPFSVPGLRFGDVALVPQVDVKEDEAA